MINKYISAIIILAALSNVEVHSQTLKPAPRLLVNVVIDQLRTDYIEHFSPLYTDGGFRRLIEYGRVYEAASYPFTPVDRASAIAAIATGTTPHYNNIVGTQWLDRNTLRPVSCTDDEKYGTSPQKLATSTMSDELKVATRGLAKVYGVAAEKDAAVLAVGHAADGAFWLDEQKGRWATSSYYTQTAQKLVDIVNSEGKKTVNNSAVADMAVSCVSRMAMGEDAITDMLTVALSAKERFDKNGQSDMEMLYLEIDRALAKIISSIESKIGSDKVMFVLTGTGYTDNTPVDYEQYRIPTGTFYINRTANLLNMYLGAVYGQGQYVEACFHNQIYINRKLLEQRKLSLSDVVSRSEELLMMSAGVRKVLTSPYSPSVSGDIMIDVAPGWKLVNEDNQEQFLSRASFVQFPIIIYGAGTQPERIYTPVTVDRIAPTIAKAIQIRAPNACSAVPLP